MTTKKIVKKIVDGILRVFGMPTYSDMRTAARELFMREIERGHAWIGNDAERYSEIQDVLRRSL